MLTCGSVIKLLSVPFGLQNSIAAQSQFPLQTAGRRIGAE